MSGENVTRGVGNRAASTTDATYMPSRPDDHQSTKITIGEDGSVWIGDTGEEDDTPERSSNFDDNLAEDMSDADRGALAHEILTGIQADIDSRSGAIETYNNGVDLLGTKIEKSGRAARGSKGTISNVKHPALIKACTKYQAGAYAELLPSDGPAKTVVAGGNTESLDQQANDAEAILNYFLTKKAPEFYPDHKRGFFYQGFCGNMFVKPYWHPIKRRPVSETVPLTKLIVSEDATDLESANRVTHEIDMLPSQVRRMQLAGVWRDAMLGMPMGSQNSADAKEKQAQGLAANMSLRPQDREYTIYECYTDFDPSDYGLKERGAPDRLPLPYRVTVDRDSREILEVRRNWREGDKDYLRRRRFVKYGFVSGLGFLDYGFLHLIGNQTRVMTGCLQILLDAGMFKSFPGGVKAKGVRVSTNEILPGLGEFVDVDIGAMKSISDAVMTFPYAEPSTILLQLLQHMEQNVDDLAGTVDMETGEGRTNVPVGTIMSQIEQQTQIMGAIHKSNHTSMAEELGMIWDLLQEQPDYLNQIAAEIGVQVPQGLAPDKIRPASDPNVPAQMHRLMLATFLIQLLQQDAMAPPSALDRKAVFERVFRMAGIADADTLFAPPPQPQQPQAPPMNPAQQMSAQAALLKAQTAQQKAQHDAQTADQKFQLDSQEQQRQAATTLQESQERQQDRQTDFAIEQQKNALEMAKLHMQHQQHGDQIMADHLTTLHDAAHAQQQQQFSAWAGQPVGLGGGQHPSGQNGFAHGGLVRPVDGNKPWLTDPFWSNGKP